MTAAAYFIIASGCITTCLLALMARQRWKDFTAAIKALEARHHAEDEAFARWKADALERIKRETK